jgi:hypothetical protein
MFYADAVQCAQWDDQILGDYPVLASVDRSEWATEPGWYWSLGDDDYEGPYASKDECYQAVLSAPHETAAEMTARIRAVLDELP